MGVYAVAGGFGKEAGAEQSAFGGKAEAEERVVERRFEFFEGDSQWLMLLPYCNG